MGFLKPEMPIKFTRIIKTDQKSRFGDDRYDQVEFEVHVDFQDGAGIVPTKLMYYDTVSKRNKNGYHLDFHNGIQSAAAGNSTGYFVGITVDSERRNLQANRDFRQLPADELAQYYGIYL